MRKQNNGWDIWTGGISQCLFIYSDHAISSASRTVPVNSHRVYAMTIKGNSLGLEGIK